MPTRAVIVVKWTLATIGLGFGFAWFAVYETSAINFFPERVAYWTGLMAVGVISANIVAPTIYNRTMKASHPAVQIGAISLIISVPVTLGLAGLAAVSGTLPAIEWWGLQYVYVVVVSAMLTTLSWLVGRLAQPPAVATVRGAGAAGLAFVDRLPVRLRTAQIYAVESEDHYLRVHTSAGQELILMRLADAVRELVGLDGLQTHRSWWVAKQGLSDVKKSEGKLVLKLKSGAEAPVSRTYVKSVKEAGWL